MAVEIERKFLIDQTKLPSLGKGCKLRQGYIETAPGNVVRIRTSDETAYLTIKGKTEGFSRLEYEYEIPFADALEMLDKLCNKPIISKTRHLIVVGGKTWELDVFDEENKGLFLAEIELESEEEQFEMPEWATREVSDLKYYRNNFLAVTPYSTWEHEY